MKKRFPRISAEISSRSSDTFIHYYGNETPLSDEWNQIVLEKTTLKIRSAFHLTWLTIEWILNIMVQSHFQLICCRCTVYARTCSRGGSTQGKMCASICNLGNGLNNFSRISSSIVHGSFVSGKCPRTQKWLKFMRIQVWLIFLTTTISCRWRMQISFAS